MIYNNFAKLKNNKNRIIISYTNLFKFKLSIFFMEDEEQIIEEFTQDFMQFLKSKNRLYGKGGSDFFTYVSKSNFEMLNRKHEGKGPIYFGQAIKGLFDRKIIGFNTEEFEYYIAER